MRHVIAAVTLAALAAAPRIARAEERATTKQAEALVHSAVAYLKKEGPEKALAAFSDPKGPFTFRDLYITAYDFDGKCLAHGAKKERIGKNLLHEKDPDGREFVKERLELARAKGSGWQEYKFLNPSTQLVETKVAYFEKVGDLVVMCGAYRK